MMTILLRGSSPLVVSYPAIVSLADGDEELF